MLYNAKEGTLKIQGAEIDYIRFGKGGRVLVMIQGLNTRGIKGAAVSLAYMYRIFAKDYTVYLFDRRANLPEGVTVRQLASDVALAMDSLSLSGADILGVSEGGMIAQYLAIDRPDLVGKMVLALTLSKNNPTATGVIENWIKLTEERDFGSLIYDMAVKMYSSAYLKRYKPLLPLLTLMQKPTDIPRFVNLARSCLTCTAYDELDKIKCPVLVIGAEEDRVVSAEASRELAERLGCEIYMYQGLGHAAYEEAPDFNRRVLDFFRR